MSILLLLVSNYDLGLFLVKVLVAFGIVGTIVVLVKFRQRRSRYKDKDLKAAGLNHGQRREWRAIERRKSKRGKRAEKKKTRHF